MKKYFTFEVQVLDAESYRISREGFASHEEYKRRQVLDARKRVWGSEVYDSTHPER